MIDAVMNLVPTMALAPSASAPSVMRWTASSRDSASSLVYSETSPPTRVPESRQHVSANVAGTD